MNTIPTMFYPYLVSLNSTKGSRADNSGLELRPAVKTTSCSSPLISKGKYTLPLRPFQLSLKHRCAFVRWDSQVTSSQVQSNKTRLFICFRGSLTRTQVIAYLPLALVLGQVDLLEHLRPLFHHQGLLVGVGRDVAVVLRHERHGHGVIGREGLHLGDTTSSSERRQTEAAGRDSDPKWCHGGRSDNRVRPCLCS